ncbi:MAG: hypothetical protein ACOZBH_02170 [Patescibacteria group bacterium]
MPSDDDTCRVSARTEEVKTYACGHSGPAEYDFSLFGNKHPVIDENRDPEKCG